MIGGKVSHFQILEKLGEGGMGVVYKATDLNLGRTVALKFLPHQLTSDDTEKERFYHEGRAASALNHPNITTIFEIHEAEGQLFLAMEYVEGSYPQAAHSEGTAHSWCCAGNRRANMFRTCRRAQERMWFTATSNRTTFSSRPPAM